ncbi:MAG: protein TolQ [Candidatus Competibacterales bacterium]|nr:protein TolQ [Candidatus Competibacterales bacterium]
MGVDTSFTQLILNASPVVQLVMLLLVLVSVLSWVAIFKKRLMLRHARQATDEFEDDFWSGIDLKTLYGRIRRDEDAAGLEAIFLAGFQEFLRLHQRSAAEPDLVVGGAQRAMRAALGREIDELDSYLPLLATVGSTSPYVGLFGTVWGIMNAFRALGVTQQATLTQVAPGIAEALIATALGLIAAIPAVVAYNRASSDVERLVTRYETFIDEFVNILQRQAHRLRRESPVTEGAA